MTMNRHRNLSNAFLVYRRELFLSQTWHGKVFLEMGSLLSCTSTTTMEYDKEWLEFCQVIYHMFGAGVINAL